MSFLRDTDWGKFLDGLKNNLKGAVEARVISESEFEGIYPSLVDDFSSLESRGVKNGDRVYYRVDGNEVHTVYLDSDGEILLEFKRKGAIRSRSLRGSFFARETDFSEKLIQSLFESR